MNTKLTEPHICFGRCSLITDNSFKIVNFLCQMCQIAQGANRELKDLQKGYINPPAWPFSKED
jgi:hypothetical protein